MREIKFRYVFKHKDGSVHFEFWMLDEIQSGVGIRKQPVDDVIAALKDDGYKLIAKDEFTGMYENPKGGEIYENDILSTVNWKLKVEYYDGRFMVGGWSAHHFGYFAIAGNIHTNPEPLRKE